MEAWKNAAWKKTAWKKTAWNDAADAPAGLRGVLRPVATERAAGLRRDHPVAPALEPFVERHWTVRWDLRGRPPFRSEVLSHPSVNVSVEDGTGPRHGHALPAGLAHGLVSRRFTIDLEGAGRVVATKFRPGGFVAYGGGALGRDTVAPLATALPELPAGLVHDVLAAWAEGGEPDGAVALLDAALAGGAPEPDPSYLELLALVGRMEVERELVRVEQVAALAGVSVRALQRRFGRWVGIGPKWVLARYRLQDAAAAMDRGDVADLASLAADLGWFDQAHFSREFRAVVGQTPSAYRAAASAARRS